MDYKYLVSFILILCALLHMFPSFSLDVVLQGQRSEVEAMITDMGVGQSAVEQLSIYCISLKK